MASEKDLAPQQPQQPARIREAGNVEKRGGWMKPTAQPSAMSRPQGMPEKPQGNAGQAGAQGSGGDGQ
jgi:hypothetical protein